MMAKDQGDVSTIEDLAGRSPQELRETLQTLPVHQIELEMQNEELGRTQSAMDTAEARYFDFYDLAPTGYVTVSDKSLILQANLTAATLLGLPRADLIGKALPGFMPAADANRYYLLCRQALATDRVQSCELCLQQSNRDVVWVNLQAIAAIGDEGTAVIRLVLSDITQRLQLEHAAKESIDEKFRLVADNTSDGIVIFGADSRIQYVSPAYVKQLGYSEAEERNRSPDQIYALIHPEDRDALFAQIEQAIESKASDLLYSYRIRHRLGHIIWREDHARFQYDGAGSYAGACVVARDITARKQAEEALQHTQALLADAEKIGRVGGWEIDVQTLQTTWTEAVYDIYEMYGTERLTVNESIKYYSSASRPIIEQAVQRAIEQGEPFDLELDIISAKGNRRSVHAVGKPDRARGKVSGFFQDITESKRAEAAMQEMNRNLIESRQQLRNLVALNETNLEKEKRHIAREVHDELGQILTALRMDLSLAIIRHADHVPDLLGALNGMKMQVDRAVEGVRNVANSLRPAALDMGLVTALEWLCLEFTKHGAVECALQGFDRDFDIDDARAMVIFRIVQEALNNVQKYAQASQVDITLERRAAELSLEVRDNGLGFDPVAVAQRGTLGLLGMRERGIALGGWVEVVSTPGQSLTTFDEQRIRELTALKLLEIDSDPEFDSLTQLASDICDAPVSLISFIDQDCVWFKSRVGFSDPQAPRTHSFCSQVLEDDEPLIVEDATLDPRFQKNDYVLASNGVRFYAGIPLLLSSGIAVGSLCVIDHKARTLAEKQISSLKKLAKLVVALIESRRRQLLTFAQEGVSSFSVQ